MINTDMIKALVDFDVISRQDVRVMRFLEELKGEDSVFTEAEEKTLVLYFTFLRDGSTCLVLDRDLPGRWRKKWEGLKEARREQMSEEDRQAGCQVEAYFQSYFDELEALPDRITLFKENFPICFIPSEKAVYARKYLWARDAIREAIDQHLISSANNQSPVNESEINRIQEKYETRNFRLKKVQAEAIVKGQNQSLVITGGPGTGKTTVVFYLLLELLQKEEFHNRTIYLTAPSGKAADRLKESISNSCKRLDENETVKKIEKAESSTIHRLLKYSPQTNAFSYNKGNPFPSNSIFVIDEASMIGVSLFARLLSAIPKGARVYILGDKDQLPSVDAGAAFEEMLKMPEMPIVELDESNRFNSESAVGRVALVLQHNRDDEFDTCLPKWDTFTSLSDVTSTDAGEDNLRLISYGAECTQKEKDAQLAAKLCAWIEIFYRPCSELSALDISEEDLSRIRNGEDDKGLMVQLRSVWNWAKLARILSAVREGVYGVENLNRLVNEKLNAGREGHYHGEFLMITRNQSTLQLFNGDFGIVLMVCDRDGKRIPHFMLEKDGGFVFYLLDLIPRDAYESAFAMTVHKAQGSGYDHLLFFLPESPLNPLANRQILYTGITRIQKGLLTIVGTPEVFKACCENRIIRETGLLL